MSSTGPLRNLTALQLDLVLNACKTHGRRVFVGDRHQAIYGFAGADSGSMDAIQNRTNAQALPLSICYRCPKKHVAFAAEIYRGIQAAPDAKEGILADVDESAAVGRIDSGDLVLCRTTEPLVALCYRLIASGKPAHVQGRDIGQRLLTLVTAISRQAGFTYYHFEKYLDKYLHAYIQKVTAESEHEEAAAAQITSLRDRIETVRTVRMRRKPTTLAALRDEVRAVFVDDEESIRLTTVHRAKGLEAPTVFLLKPELMPHPNAQTAAQKEQERNLQYVAYTRAKEALYFIK